MPRSLDKLGMTAPIRQVIALAYNRSPPPPRVYSPATTAFPFFHTMENFSAVFPRNGKTFGIFSTQWKTFTIIP